MLLIPPLLLASSATAAAFHIPFLSDLINGPTHQQPLAAPPPDEPASPRVAIVGAGAGGSAAAYFLALAKARAYNHNLDFDIDVYDRADYVGGRSTVVYPYGDERAENAVELGASIFVGANKNLWRATDEFGLDRIDFAGENDEGETGIWDGETFVFIMNGGSFWREWWSTVRVILRYGYNAPVKTRAAVRNMIDRFLTLYAPPTPRAPVFPSIAALAENVEFAAMANTTAEDWLVGGVGVGAKWTHEMVEAATRVNYGQNVDAIHAFGGACSLAATGASSVKGGNRQIFEHFVARSSARLKLNITVTALTPPSASDPLWTLTTSSGTSARYTAVLLAAPFHTPGSTIALPASLASLIPKTPYVHLHVTLLTTSSPTPDPAYFNVGATVPQTVLTTWDGVRGGAVEAGRGPEVNSLSYHGKVEGREEWVVKIFSEERVSDAWLEKVFGGKVGWVYRKEWDAYPRLTPTTEFPPIKVAGGLYYVNAMEPLISTMETQTLSARNAAELLLNDVFDAGICGRPASVLAEGQEEQWKPRMTRVRDEGFVWGWDC